MMKYFWSALNNAFFPEPLMDDYELAGWDVTDVVEVSQDIFAEFSSSSLERVRVVGNDNMPAWADLPPPTPDQLVAAAEQEREVLLSQANSITADWRTELSLGVISDDDKERLILWMRYIKDVKSVDAFEAPAIVWPEKPL